jgi:hypothetical protein
MTISESHKKNGTIKPLGPPLSLVFGAIGYFYMGVREFLTSTTQSYPFVRPIQC